MNQEVENLERDLIEKDKRINRIHLLYWAIIFSLLAVFLILIAPGSINPKAFESFSFASSLISIVLAVVSIVYSFRTGKNTGDNIAGIREIERSIDDKLRKFDELEKHILIGLQSGIDPLHQDVNSLHVDQVEIRESIEQIKEEMRQQSSAKMAKDQQKGKEEDSAARFITNSLLGNVALYLACMSFKTHKALELNKISEKLEHRKDYFYGYLVAIVVSFPDSIAIKTEKGQSIVCAEFTKFDTGVFGSEEACRQRIESYNDKGVATEYLDAIDRFFS